MTIEKAILQVAKAQGALLALTKDLLKEDKHDGLRASDWTKKHDLIFQHILEEAHDYLGLDDETEKAVRKAAGDRE